MVPAISLAVSCWARHLQRRFALTADGCLLQIATNNVMIDGELGGLRGDYRRNEGAGACFSPDGQWLFMNIQQLGTSFAITGPWSQLQV